MYEELISELKKRLVELCDPELKAESQALYNEIVEALSKAQTEEDDS